MPTLIESNMIRHACLLLVSLSCLIVSPALAVDPITPGAWTLAVLPDTQIYAQTYPQHFNAQTQFLVDQRDALNIKMVLHEGDITNNNNVPQWNNAKASMSKLDGVIPYIMAPGNHDYGPGGNAADRTTFYHNPEYFGPTTPYATQPSMGGFFEAGKTDNAWSTFTAGGQEWLALALEFGPRDAVVDWANDVVAANPDKLVMMVTHAYMYYDETIYDWATKGSSQNWNPHSYGVANGPGGVNDGQELWDKLVSKHENFRLVFNGHVLSDGTGYRATLGDHGNVVHQMLANYQMKTQGGMGDMRLLEFLPDGETVNVRTYSPVLGRYDTASDQQFTLNLNQLPPPPPILYHAAAGNLVTTAATDPAGDNNTIYGPLSVTGTGTPAVELSGNLNRGDYQVRIGGNTPKYTDGIMLASITQHSRPDFGNGRATVEVGRNSFGDGNLALSITQAGVSGVKEINYNTSVAWFSFEGGWKGAHVNANGTLAAGAFNDVNQAQVSRANTGRYTVNLGANAQNEGLLFVIGNNNADIVVQTGLLSGGSAWDVRVQTNNADFGATGIDRDWSFLYLPYDAENMVGGLYDGLANTHVSSAGDFTMTRLATGRYELTIAGESPDTGMLITSITHQTTQGPTTAPDDNILAYEPGPNGTFLINSYDLPTLNLQDTKFSWAFVGFEDKLSLEPLAPEPQLRAHVDRATGLLTLTNNGGVELAIKSITITSNAGALLPHQWKSVADNYDPTPGDGSVDSDGEWTILFSTPFQLKEAEEVAGDGGLLAVDQVVDLGELWTKSRYEDLKLRVELVGGEILQFDANFLGGPSGGAFSRSDLNADGVVDVDDWALFFPNLLTNVSHLSPVERALAGDLDGDGEMDVDDFIIFKNDYELAQGAGSFEAMLSQVPEPTSMALIAGLAMVGWGIRRSRSRSEK